MNKVYVVSSWHEEQVLKYFKTRESAEKLFNDFEKWKMDKPTYNEDTRKWIDDIAKWRELNPCINDDNILVPSHIDRLRIEEFNLNE